MPDLRKSLASPDAKRDLNHALFNRIASRYNLATRLLSFGGDGSWKRQLVDRLPTKARVCLDLATGTGDIAELVAIRCPDARVIGLDLSENMIAAARRRLPDPRFEFVTGDICHLPFADSWADTVTGGYALRNVPDLDAALAEIHRVLKPGGIAVFLDFVQPRPGFRRWAHHVLLHFWGGLVGLLLHGRPWIYRYIPASLSGFPDEDALPLRFRDAGLELTARQPHFLGILERLETRKPASTAPGD